MTDVDRTIGEHDADIRQLKKDMGCVRSDVAEIKKAINEAKGGWKTLLLVAGIAATLGGAIDWITSHIHLR